ncbi:MAG: protein translocase SEC61 complex subunit gamma, partial [Candidatus Thermoplasmatota archaeon]|nr:protein translocase SEC61 complex subunit gamma [Candidatus Thermoplasmatota archaeon]
MADEMDSKGSVEQRAQAMQDDIERWFRRRQRGDWARILRMARKPSKAEFRQTVIVCGIGMFVLGAIGFGVLWLMDNLLPSF